MSVAMVLERAGQAHRLAERYEAEAAGLRHATVSARSLRYSPDVELQAAFDRGHAEGREILSLAEAMERRLADGGI